MRRYSVWCEDWNDLTRDVVEVRVQGCWTRRGMVRKVRKLNGNLPYGATFRFYGQESVRHHGQEGK